MSQTEPQFNTTKQLTDAFPVAHYGMLMSSHTPPSTSVLHAFGKVRQVSPSLIPKYQEVDRFKNEFASGMTYALVTCAAKASLLMLYRRVFSLRVKWFRIAWWTNVGLNAALLITLVVLNCTQCKPLSTIWIAPGSCIPSQTKSASTGFINAALDLALLVLPLRTVWLLQMSQKQKVAICGVFGLGLMYVSSTTVRWKRRLTRIQRRRFQSCPCYFDIEP